MLYVQILVSLKKKIKMETSKEALLNFNNTGKKEIHYKAILSALEKLQIACSKEIAMQSDLSYIQVSRRLKELELQNKIYVVGKAKTKFYDTKVNIYALPI